MIKYASLFSGIGGFELGIQAASDQTGIKTKCVFASEFDPESKAKDINKQPARIIYNKNFGEYPHGDIKKIDASDVPDCDLIVGGPPCQDYSIAGKRAGLCGAKGSMFHEFIRIVREKQPRNLLIENVKGILSSNAGWDFAKILIELEDAGYSCEGQVLNTKNYLPQNRERVFLVGHLTGSERSGSKIFPIGDGDCRIDERTEQTAVNTLTAGGHSGGRHSSMTLLCDSAHGFGKKVPDDQNTVPTLRANTGAASNNIIVHSTLPRSSKTGKGGSGHLSRADGTTYCCDAANNLAVEIQMGNYLNLATSYKVYDKKKKTNTVEILRILRKTVGKDSTEERRFAKFITFLETEILQSEVHGGGIPIQMERKPTRTTGELQSTAADYCNRMFEMWKQEKSRYTSYRQKQIEQLIREFTSSMQELPQPYSSQKGKVQDMWETREGVGVLRETLSTVQKMGESADGETQPIHRTTGIRRLTPVEVERLMGFPDNFTAGVADSNRYRCIGNSVTVPVVADIAEKILKTMV